MLRACIAYSTYVEALPRRPVEKPALLLETAVAEFSAEFSAERRTVRIPYSARVDSVPSHLRSHFHQMTVRARVQDLARPSIQPICLRACDRFFLFFITRKREAAAGLEPRTSLAAIRCVDHQTTATPYFLIDR